MGGSLGAYYSFDENGGYYFINGNNLVNGKIVIDYSNTPKVSQETFNINNKHLDDSTILFSINGTIGNLAYYNGEPIMLGKSAAYLKANKIDKHFLYTLLQSPSILNSFMLCLTGTTIKNLGLEAIRNTDILMPTPKEQKLLGTLFSSLDDIIAFNQKNLKSLKELKKGFLQKMFV
ncbi:MAG TPA: restriction endonuclease subunit S [Veillonellaceae bacterium]|nr:restriction endonuclease subunit S [Veillonellaceae bacterium]